MDSNLKFDSLTYNEKVELIKAYPIQLYKGEELIKLYYSADNQKRLLVLKNARNLYYYVTEELIVFNEEQFVKFNECFPDVLFGGYQQLDNGYGYSVFESAEHLLNEIKEQLQFLTEQKLN